MSNENNAQKIDCLKCTYYYVTWDPKRPKGCKYFGFKSNTIPSILVLRSSGQACNMFTPKLQNGGSHG